MKKSLDVELVRGHFHGLEPEWALFDNAGGSQVATAVLARLNNYLLTSNVQLGASYALSQEASVRLSEARAAMATFVNARDPAEVVMGASTTVLLKRLATAFADKLQPGDEVVVSSGDHEANIAPWLELERWGAAVKWWHPDPDSHELSLEALAALCTPRTRLVAVTHTSNIFGRINPIRAIADLAHHHGALLCVDGVGYAPHRAVDVQALDADFYALSCYKTFGPHHALLWGRKDLWVDLPSRAFSFVGEHDVPRKFEPGNANYELSYSMLGLLDYLDIVAESAGLAAAVGPVPRATVEWAFDAIAGHEEALCARLLWFLNGRRGVRVIGPPTPDRDVRVPIVSFVVDGVASEEVVRRADAARVAIRHGHFYSVRLTDRLGLSREQGVVRASMVHYNTFEEVDRLIAVLDSALPSN